MSKRARYSMILAGICLLLYAFLCLVFPRFARFVLNRVTCPLLLGLNRLTARVPFPLSEPVAFAAGLIALLTLARAVVRRKHEALRRWLRGMAAAFLALAWALALTWLPAMARPADAPPVPDAGQLEWLCESLIDQLNAAPLAFPEAETALRLAPEAADLPGCAVKAARWPEWMRAANISGLFVPPTGEALADAGVCEALLPFTAVHELMHLAGIADEGAANIAAWERCTAFGGPFADSARLWALRYALGRLNMADPDAWRRVRGKMKDPLARVFRDCGGEALPRDRFGLIPGLARTAGDYADLVGWLAR